MWRDHGELLRIGGLSLGGLTLPLLFARRSGASASSGSFGKAKNCIILFLSGGASHHDTVDPKPDSPADKAGLKANDEIRARYLAI